MPRNMTGMAMKMSAGGYKTHMFGKVRLLLLLIIHALLSLSLTHSMAAADC